VERIIRHPSMNMPGAQLVGFRIDGLTLHGWDLARGVGGDETLDSDLPRSSMGTTLAHGASHRPDRRIRGAQAVKSAREAPLQTRLLDLRGWRF
jgi:hypothetical protein